MKEKAAQDFDEDGWGWIGEEDGKASGQNDDANEHNGNTTNQNDNTTLDSQRKRDRDYIPPYKRAVQNLILKEPEKKAKDNTDEDLIVLGDKPKETPLPPQHLMARLELLNAHEDDADGGVPLA